MLGFEEIGYTGAELGADAGARLVRVTDWRALCLLDTASGHHTGSAHIYRPLSRGRVDPVRELAHHTCLHISLTHSLTHSLSLDFRLG